MDKKVVAIIQARVASTRLPGKVLLNLEKKPVLGHVIERVKKCKLVSETIVATTISRGDLSILKLCSSKGIRVYAGSEADVLDRYYQASRLLQADHVVRITSDCPLIDPKVIEQVIKRHFEKGADYTTNTLVHTYPDGEDVEVFTFDALMKTWQEAKMASEREHVTPYIYKNPDIFKLENLAYAGNLTNKRWTLDRKEDYEFIKTVYRKLYKKNKFFGMDDILKLLKAHPEYESINQGIVRNEGYIKSLKEDKVFIN